MQNIRSDSLLASTPLSHNSLASFDPKAYLREYYSRLGEENKALLDFHCKAYARIFGEMGTASVLEFGGGPTIYQLISAAKYPVTIDFSDYLDVNLKELNVWLNNAEEKFSWDDFICYVLEIEGEKNDLCAIAQRTQLIRSKVKQVLYCDARSSDPLGVAYRNRYDIVSANFVLESIAEEIEDWERLIEHTLSLISARGYLLMSAVIGARHYRVEEHCYPVTSLTPEIVITKLEQKKLSIILTHRVSAERKDEQGYAGIFMVLAEKQ